MPEEIKRIVKSEIEREDSKSNFKKELEELINTNSMENGSDTPDFILAKYLSGCLELFDKATNGRTEWYK